MTSEERNMLDDLLAVEDGIDATSVEFLEDIDRRDEKAGGEYDLSDKQEAWLRSLYERHC